MGLGFEHVPDACANIAKNPRRPVARLLKREGAGTPRRPAGLHGATGQPREGRVVELPTVPSALEWE